VSLFPPDRLSDLERDMHIKRERLDASQARLFDRAHAQITPINIFKGSLMSTLFGLPALFFIGKFIWKGGLMSKIAKTGLLFGLKTAAPVIKPFFTSLVKKITKKFI
jgi:hypothetical protein